MSDAATSDMIDAALAVLRDHFSLGGTARVTDYLHEGQTQAERAAGIRAMQAEDARIEAEVRDVVRRALTAALGIARDRAS